MASSYLSFLQSPSAASLADDASLSYVATTTTITEASAIVKHLAAQTKQVEKKSETVLHTIEGNNGLCLETTTTLQFHLGGGTYLPSIDTNLLDEREVTFPLTHIVTFASDAKIQSIRLYWDQGTLLKQVEAIGKTGRNWPIRDGPAQIQTITSSIKASGSAAPAANGKSAPAPARARNASDVVVTSHAKRDSVSVTRDPHASLALFTERDPNENPNRSYVGPKHAIRASAKPAPREYGELFAGDEPPSAIPGSAIRSPSPHKTDGTVLKAGAGKHFKDNRLFDTQDPGRDAAKSPERKKTFGQKYEHFAFGDGEDAPQKRPTSGKTQHKQTFSFEDFSTPPKVNEKNRPDYERHWGAGVDAEDPGSPPKRPVVHAPRPDAERHFALTDETPDLGKQPLEPSPDHPAVNNARRGDEFGAHYAIQDKSPAGFKPKPKGAPRGDQDTHWNFDSPIKEKKIYKTAGDGMGSRAGRRAWGIGDESDPEVEAEQTRASARGRKAQQASSGAELEF